MNAWTAAVVLALVVLCTVDARPGRDGRGPGGRRPEGLGGRGPGGRPSSEQSEESPESNGEESPESPESNGEESPESGGPRRGSEERRGARPSSCLLVDAVTNEEIDSEDCEAMQVCDNTVTLHSEDGATELFHVSFCRPDQAQILADRAQCDGEDCTDSFTLNGSSVSFRLNAAGDFDLDSFAPRRRHHDSSSSEEDMTTAAPIDP